MRLLGNAAIVLAAVLATEVLAYLVHRYVMHGWGWGWHRSHHEPGQGWFERNDLFAVLFGAIAFGLILAGADGFGPAYWVGIGMTLYGVLYFLVHDLFTHQRVPPALARWCRVPQRGYLKRLVQAHRMHHAVRGRDGAVSYGFLYAPPVQALRARLKGSRHTPPASNPARGADGRLSRHG